jgi:hypothetical protein
MVKAQMNTAGAAGTTGAMVEASSHSFAVPADVCNRCHSDTIHPSGGASNVSRSASGSGAAGAAVPAAVDEARTRELEGQVSDLQGRLNALRDTAVISMGLALGSGGFAGLLLGIAGMSLLRRSRTK